MQEIGIEQRRMWRLEAKLLPSQWGAQVTRKLVGGGYPHPPLILPCSFFLRLRWYLFVVARPRPNYHWAAQLSGQLQMAFCTERVVQGYSCDASEISLFYFSWNVNLRNYSSWFVTWRFCVTREATELSTNIRDFETRVFQMVKVVWREWLRLWNLDLAFRDYTFFKHSF